jgi:hypothetical protein
VQLVAERVASPAGYRHLTHASCDKDLVTDFVSVVETICVTADVTIDYGFDRPSLKSADWTAPVIVLINVLSSFQHCQNQRHV